MARNFNGLFRNLALKASDCVLSKSKICNHNTSFTSGASPLDRPCEISARYLRDPRFIHHGGKEFTQAWERAVRTMLALARSLRLTPISHTRAEALGRKRGDQTTTSYYDRMRSDADD